MLTMDEQKNQNADVHNCSIDGVMNDQNTNLDDVLLGVYAACKNHLNRRN